MFRQREYNEPNNLLKDRLEYLCTHDINFKCIKAYDINSKGWICNGDFNEYRIQKEVIIGDTIIFYIYRETNNEETNIIL